MLATLSTETPAFSKTAEKRVKDRLPIPANCPHCAGTVRFANNIEVYGRPYGDWPYVYLCENDSCGAYVGTHPETNLPLGTLATAAIRVARKQAKELFNLLWNSGKMSRTDAYSWLAARMSIPVAACHFGWFDEAQCKQAIAVLSEYSQSCESTELATKTFADLKALLREKSKRGA